jgi:5-methylcytosine-specific restriction enzyme A
MPNAPPVHNQRTTKKRTQLRQAKERQAKRLYATNHPTWRAIREEQLRREPLCRECKKNGRITSGNTVDHISGDTYNNGPENLQTLCKACHDHKTGTETGFGSYSEKARH